MRHQPYRQRLEEERHLPILKAVVTMPRYRATLGSISRGGQGDAIKEKIYVSVSSSPGKTLSASHWDREPPPPIVS